jgi:hypothetical protein
MVNTSPTYRTTSKFLIEILGIYKILVISVATRGHSPSKIIIPITKLHRSYLTEGNMQLDLMKIVLSKPKVPNN